jgi:hypothetical protein
LALSWPAHGAAGLLLAVVALTVPASALAAALCLAAGRADRSSASAAARAADERAARPTALGAQALPDDALAQAARVALRARRAWAFDASRQLTGRAGADAPVAAETLARRGAALAIQGGAPVVLPVDDRSALVSVPHRRGVLVVAAVPAVAARPATVALLRELAAGRQARRPPSIPIDERFAKSSVPAVHQG